MDARIPPTVYERIGVGECWELRGRRFRVIEKGELVDFRGKVIVGILAQAETGKIEFISWCCLAWAKKVEE